VLLVLTEIFENILAEFDLEAETNASPASLLSFNLSQSDLEK